MLGKVEMPSGVGGVNGIVKYTVVDSPGVPPLTPVSLLKQVGAVIDSNSNTMDLKKIETTTTWRDHFESGHFAHKLSEFAAGCWKAPTPEQTELFQVKTDVFRPVTLPGEFKLRSSKQCAVFSSGFVFTVRDRSHLSPSHSHLSPSHQHDPDLCVDDTTSSDLFSDDQLAQGTSNFECSFASGFDVDANSAMGKLCAGRRGSVAMTCSAVAGSHHPSVVADRAGLVATSFLKNRSDRVHSFAGTPGPSRQPVASMDVCDKKRGGCGAIMNYFHSAASIAHKEAKAKTKGKKKETTISQKAAQIAEGAYTKESEDVAFPRCDRELHVFNTASGPILRCRGWSLAGTPCTLIKACHDGAVVPGGLRSTNRTGGGNSASGPGGPGTLPSRDNGTQDPPPINDWTAQVQALAANPAWVQEQFAQWQLFHQQYQHLQCQQQLVAASTTDPWQVLPENAGSTGDWWSMDTGTDRIGVQSPNPTPRQG